MNHPHSEPAEAAEIIGNLISNIESHGMYSKESTLGFLTQAFYCLRPENPTVAEPIEIGREADIAAIRHTLMTGLAHNAAIAALDRLAALSSMTPGDYLPHEEGTT